MAIKGEGGSVIAIISAEVEILSLYILKVGIFEPLYILRVGGCFKNNGRWPLSVARWE